MAARQLSAIGAPVRYAVIVTVWCGIALFAAVQAFARAKLHREALSFRQAFLDQLPLLSIWALATPLILWSARRFPCSRATWKRNVPIHLAMGSAFVFLLNAASALWALSGEAGTLSVSGWWHLTMVRVVTWYHLALIVYLVIVAIGHFPVWFAALSGGRAAADHDAQGRAPEVRARLTSAGSQMYGASSSPTRSAAARAGRPRQHLDRIAVKTGRGVHLLDVGDIAWIEAARDHVLLHVSSQCYRHRERLKVIEELLDPRKFVRVHRSAIVNVAWVKEIQPYFHGDYVLVLRNGAKVPLSRTHRKEFEATIRQPL